MLPASNWPSNVKVLLPLILRVKVRDTVLTVIHPDHDTEECRNYRHFGLRLGLVPPNIWDELQGYLAIALLFSLQGNCRVALSAPSHG